jgi:serine/threonine-protein kinase HipA
MYLHPDGIARRMQWGGRDGSAPHWPAVLDSLCASGELQRAPLAAGLQAMAPRLLEVLHHGADWGLEAEVVAFIAPGLKAQIHMLEQLR